MTPELAVTDPSTATAITGQAAASAQKSAAEASAAASAALTQALDAQQDVAEACEEIREDIADAADELVTREQFDAFRAEMQPAIDYCARALRETEHHLSDVEEIDVSEGIKSAPDDVDSASGDQDDKPTVNSASDQPAKRRTGLRHRR